jgi:hypothetical protein
VLVLVGLLLTADQKKHDRRVSGVSEALLTQGSECHGRHLLDDIINLTYDDGSYPWCRGVDGYLHLDLTTIQSMGLKGTAVVDGDRPITAETNECTQQHSRKACTVSFPGSKITIHVHL